MASITDPPPPGVAEELANLRVELNRVIPPRRLDDNLLIATWNLRAFGDLTDKWRAGKNDSPKRDLHALRAIADIVSRFDIVAIQEVKGNIKCLRHMLKCLGPDWGFIITDVSRGKRGNDERMAFVFDTRRVKPSGLACELVVPQEWISQGVEQRDLDTQFARTPYSVSFASAGRTVILVALHVIYGDKPSDRLAELRGIAKWMADWAKREKEWNHTLIVLGDFNIDRKGDPNYEAFISTGLSVPEELEGLPRTIFSENGPGRFFDQIAWFKEGQQRLLSLKYTHHAGNFDFTKVLFRSLSREEVSWKISDHYPLWAEFQLTDFG